MGVPKVPRRGRKLIFRASSAAQSKHQPDQNTIYTMKRPHNDSKAGSKAPKRHKNKASPNGLPPKAKRKVRLDELGWKTVAVPDRLEDFEGFYGLEEIEDIAIVKDPGTGYISFETTKTEEEVEQEIEEAQRRKDEEAQELEKIVFGDEQAGSQEDAQNESDEEVWEGFSDSSEELDEQPATNTPLDKPTTQAIPEEDSENDNGGDEEALTTHFSVLEDEDGEIDVSAWNSLELREELLEALEKLKFSTPTPIQASTIPEIMAGRDVIGKAATGSGKTLAFGIPIIESFLASFSASENKTDRNPVALIISPTRELAHQITAHITQLCSKGTFDAPNIVSVTGGLSVQKQRRQLEKADIVVGTPGRLWEVISTGQGLVKKFKQIRFLVVDEADRLLSQGHYQELKEILQVLDRDDEAEEGSKVGKAETSSESQRQTLVFSATFQKGLQQRLASKTKTGGDSMNKQESIEYLLKTLSFREERPVFIDVNPSSAMAKKLQEGLVECAGPEKDLYLYSLLMFSIKKRTLVFTNSISAVRRLTPFLQNLNLPALPLHSSMPQKSRLRSIERFKERPGSILVATDVAARGLDIPHVELVVHYHLPRAADAYIHRSGRTARAEATGTSILICAPEEVAGVRRLVAKVHARTKQAPESTKKGNFIRTLDIDRRVVSRLKARVTISKKLADAVLAKEKKHGEDNVLRQAAEDLGIDYDSEEFEKEAKGKRGRGSARKQKEKVAREMTKAESQALRAELRSLLSQRINTGVSARYLTSGGIDVEALMAGEGNLEFLGTIDGLGLESEP